MIADIVWKCSKKEGKVWDSCPQSFLAHIGEPDIYQEVSDGHCY